MKSATAPNNLQLNLQLQGSTYSGWCASEAAQFSPAPPITPMEQVSCGSDRLHRFGSVSSQSSAMTTDDEEFERDVVDNEWSSKEDDLLMRIYQDTADNPTVAPFAGRIPPSGIVNKVAKQVIKKAPQEGISFQHTLPNVRRRLLYLCHGPSNNNTNNSNSMHYEPASSPLPHDIDIDMHQQHPTPPLLQQQIPTAPPSMDTPAGSSRPTTPVEVMMNRTQNNNEIQSWLNHQAVQAPSPPQPMLFEFPPRPDNRPLASPFQEHLAPTSSALPQAQNAPIQPPPSQSQVYHAPTQDPYPNLTSHRKRESLKMKRMNGK